MGELHAVRNAPTVRRGDAGWVPSGLRRRNVVREAGRAKRGGDPRKGVWPTRDEIFKPLAALYRPRLDVAASVDNAKCKRFYTRHDDGLAQPWDEDWFGNPPYGTDRSLADGSGGTGSWVWKARQEVARFGTRGALLLPIKAGTKWYSRGVWGRNRVIASCWIEHGTFRGRWYQLDEGFMCVELLELEGRIPFLNDTAGWFDSAIVFFNAGTRPLLTRLANVSTPSGAKP